MTTLARSMMGTRSIYAALLTLSVFVAVNETRASTLEDLLPVGTSNRCYGRVYNTAHLAQHPDQLVTSMLLQLKPLNDVYAFKIGVNVRGKSELYQNWSNCFLQSDSHTLDCPIDCDQGHFTLEASKTQGSFKLRLDRLSFGLDCDDTGDSLKSYELNSGTDDKEFRLDPMPPSECAKLR